MDHSKINLQGTFSQPCSNSNGHMYDTEMFKRVIDEYMERMKAKKRDGIIDAIVSGEEYNESLGCGEIDRNSIGISHRIESVFMEDDILKVDISYTPSSRVEYITHDITILNTGSEL